MEEFIYFFIILINFFLFKNLKYITERLSFYDVPNQRKIHKKKNLKNWWNISLYKCFM